MPEYKFVFGNLCQRRWVITEKIPGMWAAAFKNTTGRQVKRTGNLAFRWGMFFFARRRICHKNTVRLGLGVRMSKGKI